jgi:TolB protein
MSPETGMDLYIVDPADGSSVPLVASRDDEYSPSWSPDRRRVAYARNENGTDANIYVADSESGATHVVVASPQTEGGPDWSSDGDWLAFERSTEEGGVDIFVAHPDGSGERRLTNTGGINVQPDWAPDGKRLAFTGHTEEGSELFVFNLETGASVQATRGPGGYGDPAWSPDSTKLAMTSDTDSDGSYEIQTLDVETGKVTTEASNVASVLSDLGWTTDGKGIVFSAALRDEQYRDVPAGLLWLDLDSHAIRSLGFGDGETVAW